MEVFVDELFNRGRLINSEDLFVGFVVFIALANDEYVGIRRVLRFNEEGILLRVQTGRNGVVGVDAGQVRVIERTGNLSGIEFDELEIFRIPLPKRLRSCRSSR